MRKSCRLCVHRDCCIYIWEFSFKGTDSRKQLRTDADLDISREGCGHYYADLELFYERLYYGARDLRKALS